MDFLIIVIITVQITEIYSKKKNFLPESDESVENFIYYQDCTHKKESTTQSPKPMPLQAYITEQPKRQPDCPFPRMCCSLTCGNECENQPHTVRQMEPVLPDQPLQPFQSVVQPQVAQRGRNKKSKPLKLTPIGRKYFGLTKEKIKNLISHDDDIRKILKDLVRVTMQKVDVMEMISAEKNDVTTENTFLTNNNDDYE